MLILVAHGAAVPVGDGCVGPRFTDWWITNDFLMGFRHLLKRGEGEEYRVSTGKKYYYVWENYGEKS